MTSHIELGHALVTMVEPQRETLVAYNDWYERDHFLSGVLTGPGVFAGRRFVATSDLKALRFPTRSPVAQPVEDGSFITLYWIEKGQLEAHWAWAFPEAHRLAELGRMNGDRRHVSTAYCDVVGNWGRGDDAIPVELALNHPYAGLVVVWSTDSSPDAAASLVVADGPVDGVVSLRPVELPDSLPKMPGAIAGTDAPPDLLLHCCFLRSEPQASWEAVTPRIRDLDPLLVAPFIPTIPGTRTYLDRLWSDSAAGARR